MTYYITPVCRILEASNYASAQAEARKLHPAGKARPIVPTGTTVPSDHAGRLDTYA